MKCFKILYFLILIFACTPKTFRPPDEFLNKEVGVVHSHGMSNGYGISLKDFVKAVAYNGNSYSIEWEKNNQQQWIMNVIKKTPLASNVHIKYYLTDEGDLATITRMILGGEEVDFDNLGTQVNKILLPLAQALQNQNRRPAKQE